MIKHEVKYRTWYKGMPPRPIKLQIPGWAGDSHEHGDGAKPQPWHCVPWVDGSTYGLELIYPFDAECHVVNDNGNIRFIGDFSSEQPSNIKFPPFMTFAPGHYGYTSAVDIQVPDDHVLRIEPHPRFYTDQTGTVPIPVPGHLQTEWWTKIFFVVFKNPSLSQRHIFRKGEPYAQILVMPKKVTYDIREMTDEEKKIRDELDNKVSSHGANIAENRWRDHHGNCFDDKYKVLRRAYEQDGPDGISKVVEKAAVKTESQKKVPKKKPTTIGRFVAVQKKIS